MLDNNLGILETADCSFSLPALETNTTDISHTLESYIKEHNVTTETAKAIHKTIVQPDWLPMASSVYKISPNIEDYVTVPVIIMPTDLPNRNLVAFPFQELSDFQPHIGDLTYRGWKGKPVYTEHDNLNPAKALGAVVDVSMKSFSGTESNLFKVVTLLSIDKTKSKVSEDIVNGLRTDYSMGALVKSYQCSVCSAVGVIKQGTKDKYDCMPCGKAHAGFDRHGKMRTYRNPDTGEVSLGYLNAQRVTPFEVSSVGVPAYASAVTKKNQIRAYAV